MPSCSYGTNDMNLKLPNIHKIAVLRATALGDFISATPALYALREAYPEAEIVYLGNPWHKAFLEARPAPVDRVVVVPVSHGVRFEPGHQEDPAEMDAFFEQMQLEAFDLAIQLHGGGRNSNRFILRLNAPHTAGTRTPDAPEVERWIPYIFFQNEFTRWLEVVALVGAEPTRTTPHVEVTAQDREEVQQRLPELQAPYVVLHPGASDPTRRWSPVKFAAVGDWAAECGYQVVITGVDYEREVVQAVQHHMHAPFINACDVLTISGLTGLVAQADLVISNDTGPMHLAGAVGTATVGIFWCINYPNWSHPHRTLHRPVISWMAECPYCGDEMFNCEHQMSMSYVDKVTVEDVIEQASDLLKVLRLR